VPTATTGTATTPTATTGTTVAQIRVPNVVGEQYGTAVLNVEQVGLQAVGQPMVDSHVAPGYVIKTSPPGGTLVTATQVVTIYYSALQPTATATATATATTATATPTATATCAATPIANPTPTPVPGCP
jgi:beta-lactam-binding protein with PASTA domain